MKRKGITYAGAGAVFAVSAVATVQDTDSAVRDCGNFTRPIDLCLIVPTGPEGDPRRGARQQSVFTSTASATPVSSSFDLNFETLARPS